MNVSGSDVVRALGRAGFVRVGQRGSHVKLRKDTPDKTHTVIIPLHNELAPGTLASIVRQAGMSREELQTLLK